MNLIWDSHVHLFTQEMEKEPEAWALRNSEAVWSACVAPPDRPSIQGWASVEQLLKDMDEAGIERVILLGWYWENYRSCKLQNRFYEGLIRKHPNRLSAFATIQARQRSETHEELEWAFDHGFIGVGEIHPQAQGFSLEEDCWREVLQQIASWNWPINLHVTDPDSKSHPGKIETPLEDYLKIANEWPEQIFILAHLGGCLPLKLGKEIIGKPSDNVYYDCAAIPLLYGASILSQIASVVGSDHILFGSDYPLRTSPRIQKTPDFKNNIQFVRNSGMDEQELGRIFSTNAQRLFSV